MNICGIDEAGKGCVIGPLILCGAMIAKDKQESLKDLGVRDSKLLTPLKRERLAEILPKHVKYQIIVLSPQEIDKNVDSTSGENLNWLEANKSVELINILNPEKAVLDSPSPNLKAYKSFVEERLLHKKIDLEVIHKAESKYPIVAAASILAKVTRDAEIKKIKEHVGEDFGSGYMADPKTKAFLEKAWNEHPEIFRHSWAPYKKIVALKRQQKLGEF